MGLWGRAKKEKVGDAETHGFRGAEPVKEGGGAQGEMSSEWSQGGGAGTFEEAEPGHHVVSMKGREPGARGSRQPGRLVLCGQWAVPRGTEGAAGTAPCPGSKRQREWGLTSACLSSSRLTSSSEASRKFIA